MFYQKFLEACARKGVSPTFVVHELGMSSGNLQNWKRGAVPRNSQIKKIAEYFGIPIEQLNDTIPERNDVFRPVEERRVRYLGDIACGIPQYATEEANVYISVDSDIKADFCLRAVGDSMTGARIYDGDIVLCKEQSIVDNGEIAVVIIDDEATLKRFYFDKAHGILSLYPENPNYSVLRFEGEALNKVRVIGKAIAFYGSVK